MPTHLAFVGTYTNTSSAGIYVYRHDPATDQLSLLSTASGLGSPSFLALHPVLPVLYATNELNDHLGARQGAVSAWHLAPATGALAAGDTQPTNGTHPCHLSVDRSGRFLFSASYSSGSIAMYPLGATGDIGPRCDFVQFSGHGPDTDRQEGPHAHQVMLDPANRFLYVCDLGTDMIRIFALDLDQGRLRAHGVLRVAPGAGPRHLKFHPNGRHAYVINELGSTVTAFETNPVSGMREIQMLSTLPAGYAETNYCADLHISPDGRFLYGSNRGHNSIAMFSIDAQNGHLTALGQQRCGGNWPRNFAITPSGARLIVANQESDNLAVFARAADGSLKPTRVNYAVPRPTCLLFGAF